LTDILRVLLDVSFRSSLLFVGDNKLSCDILSIYFDYVFLNGFTLINLFFLDKYDSREDIARDLINF
jgi:hypothetical protein